MIPLQNLLDHSMTATQRESFLFMRKEFPTRLANMIMELKLLPADMINQRECAEILNDYINSFTDMLQFESFYGYENELKNFTDTLTNIRKVFGNLLLSTNVATT